MFSRLEQSMVFKSKRKLIKIYPQYCESIPFSQIQKQWTVSFIFIFHIEVVQKTKNINLYTLPDVLSMKQNFFLSIKETLLPY